MLVSGKDLRVGDVIDVWWSPRRDTITELRAYTGPLAHLWPSGARIAMFAVCGGGMTVPNDDDFSVIVRGGEVPK